VEHAFNKFKASLKSVQILFASAGQCEYLFYGYVNGIMLKLLNISVCRLGFVLLMYLESCILWNCFITNFL